MWTTYFTVFFLAFFHVSAGIFQPDSYIALQTCPQYIDIPQCNPTSGSIFSTDPGVAIYTSTVIQLIYNSPILREALDLSQTTVKQYIEFINKYNLDQLNKYGISNAASMAEFGTRGIAPHFSVLTMPFLARFKANLSANILLVQGVLKADNAKSLALKFAEYMEKYARTYMTADPTSKFYVITVSFIDFQLNSVNDDARSLYPLMVYYYGNEWFVAAKNYKCFNYL